MDPMILLPKKPTVEGKWTRNVYGTCLTFLQYNCPQVLSGPTVNIDQTHCSWHPSRLALPRWWHWLYAYFYVDPFFLLTFYLANKHNQIGSIDWLICPFWSDWSSSSSDHFLALCHPSIAHFVLGPQMGQNLGCRHAKSLASSQHHRQLVFYRAHHWTAKECDWSS